MGLSLFTPPAAEPLSLDDLRDHLAIASTDLDDLLIAKLAEARAWVERETARQILTATWDYTLDAFPGQVRDHLDPNEWSSRTSCTRPRKDQTIRLPLAPVQSVTSLKYLNSSGVETTLAPSAYRVVTAGEPARIVPVYSTNWPEARAEIASVTVRFVAGWTKPADVPATLLAAIKLLVGHLMENREATAAEAQTEIPLGVDRLLALHRWGFFP